MRRFRQSDASDGNNYLTSEANSLAEAHSAATPPSVATSLLLESVAINGQLIVKIDL